MFLPMAGACLCIPHRSAWEPLTDFPDTIGKPLCVSEGRYDANANHCQQIILRIDN